MNRTQTRLTSQGQVSVPASVRRALRLGAGSALEWVEQRGQVVVRCATRHDSQAVHDALFPESRGAKAAPKLLGALKEGIRERMKLRYVRGRHERPRAR